DYLIDGSEYGSLNSDPYPIANLSEMSIPPMPNFPKGMWFSDRTFYLIRVSFSIAGIFCITISIAILAKVVINSREKKEAVVTSD
ncbi:MAG: hypothetical protein ACXAAM_06730, partial [Candidatus Heimdallarchaeaceae archaeon]